MWIKDPNCLAKQLADSSGRNEEHREIERHLKHIVAEEGAETIHTKHNRVKSPRGRRRNAEGAVEEEEASLTELTYKLKKPEEPFEENNSRTPSCKLFDVVDPAELKWLRRMAFEPRASG